MRPWRPVAPLLVAFAALSLADWALTSWAVAAGWVRLDGTGWHEGNAIAAWFFTHGGAGAFLGYKLLLFGAILAMVARLRMCAVASCHVVHVGCAGRGNRGASVGRLGGVAAVLARLR